MKLRPLTGVTSLTVEAEVTAELQAFRRGVNVLERLGLPPQQFGALADANVQLGVGLFLKAVVTARALIEAWNLEDEDGQPLPVTAASIAALFNEPHLGPQVLASFEAAADEPLRPQREEGERLRRLAEHVFGVGGRFCRGCEKANAPCARGLPAKSGKQCPQSEFAPRTAVGVAAWRAALSPGAWRAGEMSGQVLGLDWAAANRLAELYGAEAGAALADALTAIEAGRLKGQLER